MQALLPGAVFWPGPLVHRQSAQAGDDRPQQPATRHPVGDADRWQIAGCHKSNGFGEKRLAVENKVNYPPASCVQDS
jgi:hypothetical protein